VFDGGQRQPPRSFGWLTTLREQGGEILIGEDRAEVIAHLEIEIAVRKGGSRDASSLFGDWRDGLRA